jgi:hypothetical protein
MHRFAMIMAHMRLEIRGKAIAAELLGSVVGRANSKIFYAEILMMKCLVVV